MRKLMLLSVLWACAALAAPEREASLDPTLGVPRLLWGPAATQPTLVGGSRKPADLEAAGRARLAELAPTYKLAGPSLAAVEVLEVRGAGSRLVRFGQRFDGLPVLGRELSLTLDAAGALVLASGNLSPTPPQARFALDVDTAFAEAWRAATKAAGGPGADQAAPRLASLASGAGWMPLAAAADASGRWRIEAPSRVRKGWQIDGRALRPVYDFELMLRDGEGLTQTLSLRVDGADRRLIQSRSLTSHTAYQYRVWASASAPNLPLNGPQGDALQPYPVAAPDGMVPAAVSRNLVSIDATSYRPTVPWFPSFIFNATSLDGHQVEAYADADGGGPGTGGDITAISNTDAFDFAFDATLAHDASTDQIRATLMQAFFVTNHIADWFYLAGFDEAGGNHQFDNFGLGGLGGDRLILQTADPEVSNNANASVPADGASPKIQMGVWQGDLMRRLRVTGNLGTTLDFQGNLEVGTADFGPKSFDLTDELVVARDDAGVDAFDLCEPPTNAAAFAGKIALVRRGNCFFVDKAFAVQSAGAVGMVVDNHTAAGQLNGGVTNMSGTNAAVTIPSMFVSLEDGATLRDALANGEVLDAHLERTAGISIDSAADSSIVAHEWGHVLVNRNVNISFPSDPDLICFPDPQCYTGPQPQGINEGTADFIALLYLTGSAGSTNAYSGTYAVSQWAGGQTTPDGGYFGIRRYPYSTDMTKDPLTFQHIGLTATLPPSVPLGENNSPTEVHAVGEVWAVALWDAYVGMLNSGRYTHAAARDRMRDYLVAALKVMPDDPTFLEARDVFYAVVLARTREDHTLFAQAFAKRGMGMGAVGPSVHDRDDAGIVESFVVQPTPAAPPPPPPPPPPASGGGGTADPSLLLLALAALLGRAARHRSALR